MPCHYALDLGGGGGGDWLGGRRSVGFLPGALSARLGTNWRRQRHQISWQRCAR